MAGCDAGNPNIECACLKSSEIEAHIQQRDMEELQNLNQYCVEKAWFKIDFGGCPYGIFSTACPVEPLHAVENGLITTCLKILLEELIRSPSQKALLDFLAKQFPKLHRQHYSSSGACKSMPSRNFSAG